LTKNIQPTLRINESVFAKYTDAKEQNFTVLFFYLPQKCYTLVPVTN